MKKSTKKGVSRSIEKKRRNENATKRSLKTASEIILGPKEEIMIVDLIAEFDSIKVVDNVHESKVSSGIIRTPLKSSSLTFTREQSDSEDEEEVDDQPDDLSKATSDESDANDSQVDNAPLEWNSEGLKVMNRPAFIRKLIRDDRFHRKALLLGKVTSAEKEAARIRNSMKTGKVVAGLSPMNSPTILNLQHSTALPNTPKLSKVASMSTVRVFFGVEKSKGKVTDNPKVNVIKRSSDVSALIEIARKKLSVGSKFCQLKIRSSGKLLDEYEMMSLPDDEMLILVEKINSDVYTQKEEASASIPQEPLSKDINIGNKESISDKIADEEKHDSSESIREEYQWRVPEAIDPINGHSVSISVNTEISKQLKTDLETWIQKGSGYREIKEQRESLPIFSKRVEILSAIETNQVVIVCGETGSGKTTQLPHFILEDMIAAERGSECSIVCTQPRRIAAISIADRVTFEAGQREVGKGLVGYKVRLDSRTNENTRLVFCTTGILLRQLQNPTIWSSLSHIILDEVHERGVETDFLMTILKQELANHPHLRLILMSATMQEGKFKAYFGGCPVVYVCGRTFPVAIHYIDEARDVVKRSSKGKSKVLINSPLKQAAKEDDLKMPRFDADLVAELICGIVLKFSAPRSLQTMMIPAPNNTTQERGDAILVFLSGIQAITKVNKALHSRIGGMKDIIQIHILHGSLPPERQRAVFRRTAPGQWKIVLATNIAETSITVDDATHVIDTGFMKEQRYDPFSGLNALQEVFAARSNASQRAGRAGRVRPGHCWRLFSEEFFLGKEVQEYALPEIKRIAIEEVVLQVILLKLGRPESFLGKCLEPPSPDQLRAALATLVEIKAILPQAGFPLTALGYHLAKMPVDVRVGKMLIFGTLFGVLEPVLTIAAYLSGKSPFLSPVDSSRERARKQQSAFLMRTLEGFSGEENLSDHIATVCAFNEWLQVLRSAGKEAAFLFARENFLSHVKLIEIKNLREHFREYLHRAGFLKSYRKFCAVKESKRSAREGEREGERGAKREAESAGGFVGSLVGDDDDDDDDDDEDEDEDVDCMEMRYDCVLSSEACDDGGNDCGGGRGGEYGVEDRDIIMPDDLVRCALCAGFFPNVARAISIQLDGGEKERVKLVQKTSSEELSLHPSSLLSSRVSRLISEHHSDAFLVYYLKSSVTPGRVSLFDASVVPHPALLLFAGNEIMLSNPGKKSSRRSLRVVVNGWIEMELSELHLACFRRLQREIESLLRVKVESPNSDTSKRQHSLSKAVCILISSFDE